MAAGVLRHSPEVHINLNAVADLGPDARLGRQCAARALIQVREQHMVVYSVFQKAVFDQCAMALCQMDLRRLAP